LALVVPTLSAQPPATAPSSAAALSRADMEAFLTSARVVRKRGVSRGVTGTVRVTLSDGRLTHDASVQTIDERRQVFTSASGTEFNFRDSWRFNVAAYLLDKLLDINMIPATVHRRFDGKDASFTWWVDDVMMEEAERLKTKASPPNTVAWNDQMFVVRVFDQLIYNVDRNLGNLLISAGWRVWMIDHSRAFRLSRTLKSPADLTRVDRQLLERLRTLDVLMLEWVMRDYLHPDEIQGLLARRDLIVAHFEQAGPKVLYDLRRLP
jgi:hypothetical protein